MSIHKIVLPIIMAFVFNVHTFAQKSPNATSVQRIKLNGYLGKRVDQCVSNQIMTQNLDHIIEPFKHKNESSKWQSEFWGKWTLGACDAYRYNKNPELLAKIKYGAYEIMKTQLSDGYIGNYSPEHQLAQWDVWGRKYSLLGLQAYYSISQDKKALESAIRLADHLLTQVGPGRANIATLGNYRGLAAGSILEPMVSLYNTTKDERYLDFAKYIVKQWETPEGPQLVSKAFENVPVADRFLPIHKAAQWTLNGHKAYEMMSCYVGLLALYKVVGETSYLEAAERTAMQIMEQELSIVGSASSTECFWHGAKNQTTPTFLANETCVTYTWMQLCDRLYQITGKAIYMDEFERTAYNALQASMNKNGTHIASYVGLDGFRRVGERQCGLDINCCEANGPRGFALLPHAAVRTKADTVSINLYNNFDAQVQLPNKSSVQIALNTTYPINEDISLQVDVAKSTKFTLALRIPAWSKHNEILVNDVQMDVDSSAAASYVYLAREWKKGDKIHLKLQLEGRLVKLNNHVAITRGPIVLVRDSRFNDGYVDESIAIEHDKNNRVPLQLEDKDRSTWMNFSVHAVTSIYNGNPESFRRIQLCDFASAGDTWDETQRYRTWLVHTIENADRETWW